MKNFGKIIFLFILIAMSYRSLSQTMVINEIMFKPGPSTTGCDQKLVSEPQITCGREYIELYNSDCNNNFDLSGFVLASANATGAVLGNAGAICFPQGTIVPAGSFLIVGGANDNNPAANGTYNYPANSFDFKIPSYFGTQYLCLNTANTYWFLGNYDGWMALYDPSGTVHSAVYWSSSLNNILTVADFSVNPCSPSAYSGTQLQSAKQIYQSNPALIQYMGDPSVVSTGNTFSRYPDGGAFQSNRAPTIGPLRSNRCNDGLCIACGNLNLTSKPDTCGRNNGSIDALILNTIASPAPYTYNLSGPVNIGPIVTSNNPYVFNNLPAGTYVVSVDDSYITPNHTVDTIIVGAAGSISISNITSTPEICGASDGTASVTATGSTGNYSYKWSSIPTQTTQTATNLTSGTYIVTVNDGPCSAIDTVIVGSSGTITTQTTQINETCGYANGSATVIITSGVGTYNYLWSTIPIQTTATASNLAAGTYFVTVTKGSCTVVDTVIITNTPGPDIQTEKTDEMCSESDGSATVHSINGKKPYSFKWNTNPSQTDSIATGIPAGTYTVTVTDANNCTATATVTLSNTPGPILSIGTVTDATFGQSDGAASVNVSSGSPTYSFLWDTNPPETTATASNLPAGTYNVTVTDQNNCTDDIDITIKNKEVEFTVFIPNAFTPNGDAINDGFAIKYFNVSEKDFNMLIFNRWGELVYQTSDINAKWNGRYNNNSKLEDFIDATYVYRIELKDISGEKHSYLGRITLFH